MKPFLDNDFLLSTKTAKHLYHEYSKDMPIIDYHCHINPNDIAHDIRYSSITEVWLGEDHYKWRAMRANGVPERFITGGAEPAEKFQKWAETIPNLIGNPLYHWTHLELQRYFDIREPLCGQNAMEVYEACNKALARPDMSVRGIIKKSNIKLICTTDDPVDDLKPHEKIAADTAFKASVLPAFRPDKLMNPHKPGFIPYIKQLESVCGFTIDSMDDLRQALEQRIDYFASHGCVVSDHALESFIYMDATEEALDEILSKTKLGSAINKQEIEEFQTAILIAVAKEYHKRDWVMQLHFSCIRNNSEMMFKKLGPDTGFDAIDDMPNARKLALFLNALEKRGILPKIILYSLNPTDNEIIASIMGCFQTDSCSLGRIQLGSAWWFNDNKRGMEKQILDLANLGVLGSFIGMLTDSRSFLSYVRHEYFRRILCNLLGELAENGEYPYDLRLLGEITQNISYYNTKKYFGFKV